MNIKFGILNQNDLIISIKLYRKKNKKIVMTNGVFDILHPGHIQYLNKAKKMGDKLIIAVNNDKSAQKIKGNNRPFNKILDRMIVLSALKAVDWVTCFKERTPILLIKKILPDLLVKGNDYKINQISGAKEVLKYGGKVKLIKFDKRYSTSIIINNIQNNI